MVLARPADDPRFACAVQQAVDHMHEVEARLRAWRSQESSPDSEYDLLHLISLTALIKQRAQRLYDVTPDADVSLLSADLPAALAGVFNDLVAHMPAGEDPVALQLVLDVGTISRRMTRDVERA